MRRAMEQRADGIAVSIIDPRAFNAHTDTALELGIPVMSYNADGGIGNRRLAYVGQDLYQSGLKFGSRIVELVREGDVLLFIATPGQLNIQPRVDGALDAMRDSGRPIHVRVVATGADVAAERRKVEATYRAQKNVRGMFAVDGGSTQASPRSCTGTACTARACTPEATTSYPGRSSRSPPGGSISRSTSSPTCRGCSRSSSCSFRYSDGLVSPADTNTGLKFVTRHNVRRYLTTRSRYEGSSRARTYPDLFGPPTCRPIALPVRLLRTLAPQPLLIVSGKGASQMGRLKTSLGIWAFGSMVTRFMPVGYQPALPDQTTAERVHRAVTGLGDLIDDYEFHYPAELSPGNLDEVRSALDGHGIYTHLRRAAPRSALRPRRPRLARSRDARRGARA